MGLFFCRGLRSRVGEEGRREREGWQENDVDKTALFTLSPIRVSSPPSLAREKMTPCRL